MRLDTLAEAVDGAVLSGGEDVEIRALCHDSREAVEGAVFFALRGGGEDGHGFVNDAIANGASAVVVEKRREEWSVPCVTVGDSRAAMSAMADAFHGRPSLSMMVAGITGTNGKTTSGLLLHSLLNAAHRRCGLIGTINYDLGGGEIVPATHTTPESSELQAHLAAMVDNGCRAAVMEVSSHGLDQGRAADVAFDIALFTNLSHDHLDYHADMEAYFVAKRSLFVQLAQGKEKKSPTAVINYDDRWGKKLLRKFPIGGAVPVTYGMGQGSDYRATDLRMNREGIEFKLEVGRRQFRARIPLIGRFNVYNALGALAAAVAMGLNLRETVAHLANLPQVPGRLQSVSDGRAFHVFVDYAHSPDALENALQTLRDLDPKRLVVVFGCGGGRDIPKRAAMGAIASRIANYTIITSDNPRKEEPGAIIRDIEAGIDGEAYEVLEDRREAIAAGISYMTPGDILLIAGKGHEDYQEFADETIEFDDCEVARQMLSDRDLARADMVWERRREEEAKGQAREARERENKMGERRRLDDEGRGER
jgi:UDP-N-acetylmuramoyl-L-alanyl-D-glutamate--2,6-diaminopimelate ligase